ncbi:MAG TPA: hypothetical protein VG889_06135 [Rhizomicrobium sp.]|nr:hypothetical protein [Rhizomicrobium sp.]
MRRLAIALLALTTGAHAGAWTEPKGQWLSIASLDLAGASKGYDAQSNPRAPVKFDKSFSKSLIEYGWSDRLTLFAAPEYSTAVSQWQNGMPVKALDLGIEAGARYRVSDAFGILSAQASLKYAGPYDLSHGPIQAHDGVARGAARREELRVLYGTGFTLWGRGGFADIEAAQRFVTSPLPDETVLDATAGLRFGTRTCIMFQSFNVVSGGDGRPPYTYFRTHKLELSVVRDLSARWSLQLGGFVSPAGQNSLVEQGVEIALWLRK